MRDGNVAGLSWPRPRWSLGLKVMRIDRARISMTRPERQAICSASRKRCCTLKLTSTRAWA